MQSRLVIVYKDAGGYVHRINQTQALHYAALFNFIGYFISNIDKAHALANIESQMFSM